MSCVVPGCKSNYKSQEESTSVFHFPRDQKLFEEWFRATPRVRKDYEANKQLRVSLCISLTDIQFTLFLLQVSIHHLKKMTSKERLPTMMGFIL